MNYRGKRIDNGEWVYGYLIGKDVIVGEIELWEEEYFWTEYWYKVDPKTVGQYTGFDDMEGNRVYVGDILYRVHEYASGIVGYVQFVDGCFLLRNDYPILYVYMLASVSKVVGNVHENPDMVDFPK